MSSLKHTVSDLPSIYEFHLLSFIDYSGNVILIVISIYFIYINILGI